jgi:transcriptional regulator with XRE-family HTH domain
LRRRDLNQSEFANLAGVKPATVSRWVNNERAPDAEYLLPIADALMVDYDLVATKAGYRPPIHEVPPDSREARAAHLVSRIDWETQAAGFALSMLEQLAHEVPKGKVEGA